ncbi:MAG: hypothetical protein K9K79_13175 [Desulfohalobiaceae bacterium]|nr:hypothetical protein [Desulfohalobiaceae bacterium]
MDKDMLLEMARNPELIPGIYNYCNRWCERCIFTARCLQFQMEEEEERFQKSSKSLEENAAFLEQTASALSLAMELIQDFAESEGIDLDDLDLEEEMEEQEKTHEAVRNHACSQAALDYAKKTGQWFDSSEELWQAKEQELNSASVVVSTDREPGREVEEISDAAEVIRWHQHFIAAKIMRALTGKCRSHDIEDMPSDSDGSAKVALVAIDHSMAAWMTLLEHFPGKQRETLGLLSQLRQMQGAVERMFPKARSFVRPGFDEIDGDDDRTRQVH